LSVGELLTSDSSESGGITIVSDSCFGVTGLDFTGVSLLATEQLAPENSGQIDVSSDEVVITGGSGVSDTGCGSVRIICLLR